MAGGSFQESDDSITGINVTPLVDVMLVLLIIFMVTATYIVNRAIDVSLPKAETGGDMSTESENLAFVLNRQSQLFANGKPIQMAEIQALVTDAKKKHPNAKVQALISADKDTPHGAVIKLIDSVRQNGISDFAINVEAGGN